MEVQNTQNKIYNNARRTYLDEGDLKEGEIFCKKCLGVGEILPKEEHFGVETCPKCGGRGIVDWVQNAVNRPIVFGSDSSSSSSLSSWSPKTDPKYNNLRKMIKDSANQMKLQAKSRLSQKLRVTKYKRRKVV